MGKFWDVDAKGLTEIEIVVKEIMEGKIEARIPETEAAREEEDDFAA